MGNKIKTISSVERNKSQVQKTLGYFCVPQDRLFTGLSTFAEVVMDKIFIAQRNGEHIVKRLKLKPNGDVLRCDTMRIFNCYEDAFHYQAFLHERFNTIKKCAENIKILGRMK